MRDVEEILREIASLKPLAEDFDTERQSTNSCVAAGAHDALRWALGVAEQPLSEHLFPSTEEQVKQLMETGWTRESANRWKSPKGEYFRGPYGAWRKLAERRGKDHNWDPEAGDPPDNPRL